MSVFRSTLSLIPIVLDHQSIFNLSILVSPIDSCLVSHPFPKDRILGFPKCRDVQKSSSSFCFLMFQYSSSTFSFYWSLRLLFLSFLSVLYDSSFVMCCFFIHLMSSSSPSPPRYVGKHQSHKSTKSTPELSI